MKRLRLWILGATLGSFLAGMNAGLVIPRWMAGDHAAARDTDQAYVRSLVADFALRADQERSLWFVLERCREEEEAAFRSAEPSLLPPSLQTQLLEARGRREQRFRALLDPEQRARYDLVSRPK